MDIGKRIAELRKARKWTQQELADKLYVTDKAVSKWEQGLGSPELSTVVALAKVFGVSTDYLLMGLPYNPIIKEETIKDEKEIMTIGESIEARTHAEFLNILLDKNYKGYMKCGYNFDQLNLIWMIRLDNQLTNTGWINRLEPDGERIIEDFAGFPSERLETHKHSVYHQRRYVFDIVEQTWGRRKYVFRGVFEFCQEEGNNNHHVWNKVADTANFKQLLNG